MFRRLLAAVLSLALLATATGALAHAPLPPDAGEGAGAAVLHCDGVMAGQPCDPAAEGTAECPAFLGCHGGHAAALPGATALPLPVVAHVVPATSADRLRSRIPRPGRKPPRA